MNLAAAGLALLMLLAPAARWKGLDRKEKIQLLKDLDPEEAGEFFDDLDTEQKEEALDLAEEEDIDLPDAIDDDPVTPDPVISDPLTPDPEIPDPDDEALKNDTPDIPIDADEKPDEKGPAPEAPAITPEEKPAETGSDRPEEKNDQPEKAEGKTDEAPKADTNKSMPDSETPVILPAGDDGSKISDPVSRPIFRPSDTASFSMVTQRQQKLVIAGGKKTIALLPDFTDARAWKASASPYNTPWLWGQCTWFAWGRFFEIYGFDPGFSGNGNQCAGQLVAAHGDLFQLSRTPEDGSVFSGDADHNHVGIVLKVDGDELLIQEGNLDGVSNDWPTAIRDWRTIKTDLASLRALYGDVIFAVPKEEAKKRIKNRDLSDMDRKKTDGEDTDIETQDQGLEAKSAVASFKALDERVRVSGSDKKDQ